MWAILDHWQLNQLQRLAKQDPERIERILNQVWAEHPGLFEELAIAAVDQEMLPVEQCADLLKTTPEAILERRASMRRAALRVDCAIEFDEATKMARITDSKIAVWEVVRQFRITNSIEAVVEALPSLTEAQVAAAVKYADEHPREIDSLIHAYEVVRGKRKEAYPFAR